MFIFSSHARTSGLVVWSIFLNVDIYFLAHMSGPGPLLPQAFLFFRKDVSRVFQVVLPLNMPLQT
jgi:hypothetical protein